MKKLIIIFALTLSGCNGIHRDIKKVDCTGVIRIQSVKKNIGLKLKKYDVINKQFYSTGMPSFGMMGWFESKDFDQIRCSHKPF